MKLTNVNGRQADYPVERIFLQRWSPRAMSGEPVSQRELMTLFEAARWAPSTYNEQEWKFLFARHYTAHWPAFFELLQEGNRQWCQHASILVVVIAHKVFTKTGEPNPVHLFDAGSAWENLALQASSMRLVAHGMMGFDFDKARQVLHVPDDYDVAAMMALGRPGDPDALPENLRQKEKLSNRKPIHDIIHEGPLGPINP